MIAFIFDNLLTFDVLIRSLKRLAHVKKKSASIETVSNQLKNQQTMSEFERCLHLAQEVESLANCGDYTRVEKLLERVRNAIATGTGKNPLRTRVLTMDDFKALLQSIEIVTQIALREPLLNTHQQQFNRFAANLAKAGTRNAQFKELTSGYELNRNHVLHVMNYDALSVVDINRVWKKISAQQSKIDGASTSKCIYASIGKY